MKAPSVLFTSIIIICSVSCSQEPSIQPPLPSFGENLPDGYGLVYETNFSDPACLDKFQMTDPSTWRMGNHKGIPCLELFKGVGAYDPQVRSPRSFALLNDHVVGDFILEMDVESSDLKGGNHRDACFFFGFTSPSTFYYVHIAAAADPNAHNIFLVDNAPRTNIATHTTSGITWGRDILHRVRIERTLADGLIRVFFDDMTTPVMETHNTRFDHGYVGFGSFDNTCRFYNFKLYSPSVKLEKKVFFGKDTKETPSGK